MFKVEVLDKPKKVVLLKWDGVISKEEVADSNNKLEETIKGLGTPFRLLVDTSGMKLIKPDALEDFTKQQLQFLSRIDRLGVVNTSQLTKLQLRKMSEKAQNEQENFFTSYEDALAFLKA